MLNDKDFPFICTIYQAIIILCKRKSMRTDHNTPMVSNLINSAFDLTGASRAFQATTARTAVDWLIRTQNLSVHGMYL